MEQRYQAVLAVQVDGLTVTEAIEKFGVSRQTMHAWLARYEAGGLEALKDRSHRRDCQTRLLKVLYRSGPPCGAVKSNAGPSAGHDRVLRLACLVHYWVSTAR
jgi:transposase